MASGDRLSLDGMIDEATRQHARRQQAAGGDHPSEQELVDYQEGRLGEREAEALRHHLAYCRDCADDLLELEDWDARLPTDPTRFPTSVSMAARRRAFEERAGGAVGEPAAASGEKARRLLPFRWPIPAALAAALAIASLALGLWLGGLGSGGFPSASPGPADHPFFFDLVPDGAAPLRSGSDHEVRVPAGMNPLVVRLNLGDQTPHEEYRVEVATADGGEVWERRGLARQPSGSFALLIDLADLGPGSYRLRLLGRDGAAESVLATYSFSLDHALPE